MSSAIAFSSNFASAQIIPDGTLGAESSVLTPNVNIEGFPADQINGGAIRGANLFHSFLDFNIGEGQRVYFANPVGIENILSRVTGSNLSAILGTLGVDGGANLFFLNPNGIIFGPNATLDIAGSLMASTANSLVFENGLHFSATNPEAPPLLTINLHPGLQYGSNQSSVISNAGNLAVGQNLTLAAGKLDLQGQLSAGQDLTMQASDNVRVRDSATNPFIASAGGQLLVEGEQGVDIFALNHPESGFFSVGDMILRSGNTVGGDAHYTAGGNFRIEQLDGTPGNLYSPHDPVIRANGDVLLNSYTGASLHIFAGGSVDIPAFVWIQGADPVNGIVEDVVLSDGKVVSIDGRTQPTLDIRAGTTAFGIPFFNTGTPTSADIRVGTIVFAGADSDFVDGPAIPLAGTILLTNQYLPNPDLTGDIVVLPTQQVLGTTDRAILNGDFASGGTVAMNSRGNITINGVINADAVLFDNTLFGNGGDVALVADRDITLTPGSLINSSGLLGGNIRLNSGGTISVTGLQTLDRISGIASINSGIAPGLRGGNIDIVADSLFISDGAVLISSTVGQTDAGNISIQVNDLVSLTNESQIRGVVESGAIGRASDIDIQARSLFVAGGSQINSVLFREQGDGQGNIIPGGQGSGGSIRVNATDSITLFGIGSTGFSSGLLALTERGAFGPAGNITVNTGDFLVVNGAVVQASTFNPGDGGNIVINTTNFAAVDGGQVLSLSRNTGDGGIIQLNATDTITLSGKDPNFAERLARIDEYLQLPGQTDQQDDVLPIGLSNSGLFVTNLGDGLAGDITLTAKSVFLSDAAFVEASTYGGGNGGNVLIQAQSLSLLRGSEVLAQTFGAGKAGDITVEPLDPASPSFVTLSGIAPFSTLDVDGNPDGGFSSGLFVTTEDSATGQGGSINVTTGALRIEDGAVLSARARSDFDTRGGDITVNVNTLDITNGGQILTTAFSNGLAGGITVNATGDISISGFDNSYYDRFDALEQAFLDAGATPEEALRGATFIVDPVNPASGLQAQSLEINTIGSGNINITSTTGSLFASNNAELSTGTAGSGNAGIINIQVAGGVFLDNARIFSTVEPGAIANGGQINIQAGTLSLANGSGLQTLVRQADTNRGLPGGQGEAGDVNVDIVGAVTLSNSGIFSQLEQGAMGKGGNINLDAASLYMTSSELAAGTFGMGAAGNVLVQVDDSVLLTTDSTIRSLVEQGGVGDGGNIDVTARSLTLLDGSQISASVFREENGIPGGKGRAGNLQITAPEFVFLSGIGFNGFFSGLLVSTEQGAEGSAGSITVNTGDFYITNNAFVTAETQNASEAGSIILNVNGNLTIENQGFVSVSGKGSGNPGNLEITADSIVLNQGGRLQATSASGANANITLRVQDSIIMNGDPLFGSEISAEAFNNGAGGNIDITALAILAVLPENSDIVANAYAGTGGNITARGPSDGPIIVRGFRQFEETVGRTPQSDFVASSDLGIDGSVEINTEDNLESPLPAEPIDATRLIARTCSATRNSRQEESRFTVIGRGGLPPNPNSPLQSESIVTNWVGVDQPVENPTDEPTSATPESVAPTATNVPKTSTYTEAQGWVIGEKGEVILTAQTPTVTPHNSSLAAVVCNGS
ncbi:MAG: filamentous hemagglutinin N-terminal domain-containing protein [Symplocastrum torsivum CPER-KK1]|jgi:filamentous hemagglutinin family protein|uniref:Filamentous hemagglutinin N-terminal domain-containing protein n=1 Tax=Symplocastrum torsivum CPER-KK1 TaxID=450513 RepID=A0A951PGQ9_9CYAN|nr:filamentous hemagglutinin N-terminal domain-containing protein [Symplocastrum torsivum CPER-KK1]